MKEVDIARLIQATTLIGQARAALLMNLNRMTEILAPERPVEAVTLKSRIFGDRLEKAKARAAEAERQLRQVTKEHHENLKASLVSSLDELIGYLESLDLPITLAHARRVKCDLAAGHELPQHAVLGELGARLFDEIRSRKFLSLTSELGALYNTQQFAPEVRLKFPSAVVDIDEAMNCLALERSTAVVFHLMRVLEIAVRATARCLGIPDPVKGTDKNWGTILRAIKGAMDAKWPSAADKMMPDAKLFENLYLSLDAVRNPWRNATMHVENSYTMEEAQRIRNAVEGLMITIANRFDESGLPLV